MVKLTSEAWIAVAAVTLVAIYGAWAQNYDGAMRWSPETLRIGLERPPLWIYVNEGDVNSRYWSDFGARSSRALNLPILNLCYESIVRQNGTTYRIEVIRGLQDMAIRMGGWEALPVSLRDRLAPVGKAEMNWIRTAVLAKWGGLWLDPSVICIHPIPVGPKDHVVGYGTDWNVPNAGAKGTPAAGTRALWSPFPSHPMMVEWEAMCRSRLDPAAFGGRQVRNDWSEDWLELAERYKASVRSDVEIDRKGVSKKRIEVEDILAAGTEGSEFPFALPPGGCFVSLPWDDLQTLRAFGWILRMSEEQIISSDLVVRHLFNLSGVA